MSEVDIRDVRAELMLRAVMKAHAAAPNATVVNAMDMVGPAYGRSDEFDDDAPPIFGMARDTLNEMFSHGVFVGQGINPSTLRVSLSLPVVTALRGPDPSGRGTLAGAVEQALGSTIALPSGVLVSLARAARLNP